MSYTPAFQPGAKKHLGQNFLHDTSVIDRIVQAISPKPGDAIVEIGPGQGALTFPLMRANGGLTAIEFDRDMITPLSARAAEHGNLRLINANVLDVDFTALASELGVERIRLAGNLPYNLSSPILFHAVDHLAAIRDMHFMLQKEVVERMAASPGSKVYGRLSVMLQAVCHVVPLFIVPPTAFRPAPKVDSAIVRLAPLDSTKIDIEDRRVFSQVVRAAFGQRRKTLRNALNGVATSDLIVAAGLKPEIRAEQVSVPEFIHLANLVARNPAELPDSQSVA